jgi:SSS family solute:Na+ symporter
MHWIDWTIIAVPLLLLVWVGWYTRQYMKSVADFLSGGRMAGRYLLAVAKGEQGVGAVVFVAMFEMISKSGFITTWWGWMGVPVVMLVGISGWVIYRFRETRALTLAQFFEIRYSRRFRVFTGIVCFVAGMLNFGIIPAVGARCLTYFLGLPQTVHIVGFECSTYIILMAVLISITLALTLSGGLITLMITNCLEGMISQVLFLVIIFTLLAMFSWSEVSQVLTNQPAGKSLLNPFDALEVKDFNVWMVLMGFFGMVYRTMAWQNQGAYSTASVTAHESRMGGIMASWRGMGNLAVITLLAVCAMTYLNHPNFAVQSAAAKAEVAQIAQPRIQEQMNIPIAVTHMLPIGVKGALCVILLMGVFGGDGTHLLSWGSIFIQDVILPQRKKPFTKEGHIKLLRWSMIGVAIYAFLFGAFFKQTDYIFMWWLVTETLFVGGAGAAIIGGLYWKKGTTAAAWAGFITGSGLVTGGILAQQIWEDKFPLNGAQISFFGSLAACAVYTVVSLLTCKEDYNMDRLLHRGKYAVAEEKAFETKSEKKVTWGKLIGLDDNFTLGDKWLAGGLFGWNMIWFGVFLIGCVWNYFQPWPITVWSDFWYVVAIGVPIAFAVITAVWFTWGGIKDMREFFHRLKLERVNVLDNGMVINHQSQGDFERNPGTEPLDASKL